MAREIASLGDVQNNQNPATTINDFKDRLVKLIPSEIITAYTTIFGLITGAVVAGNKNSLLLIVFALLLILTPFYLYYVSHVTKAAQIVFTTVAFAIWVSVIGGPFDGYHPLGFPLSFIGSIVLIFYTLLIPFVYKG